MVDGVARHPVQHGPGQGDRAGGRGQRARGPGRLQPGPGPGLQALGQQVPGHRGESGIGAAAEAGRGVGVQPVPVGHGAHRAGVEEGALQQHPPGAGGHLGAVAAHGPGQADGAGVIGDEQVLRRELALDPVQGHQGLPRPGPAHGDPARHLVGVEGVGGVAVAVQQLVGGVHRRQPLGRRAHGRQEGPHRAGGAAGPAQFQDRGGVVGRGVPGLQPDRHQRFPFGQGRVAQGAQLRPQLGRQVPGQAAVGLGVAAVGGDIHLQHRGLPFGLHPVHGKAEARQQFAKLHSALAGQCRQFAGQSVRVR